MNAYEWKTKAVASGYLALFRRVDRSEYETIRGRNGKPRIFRRRHLAENAAMRLLLSFVNIDIRCWRAQRRQERKAAAEALFKASPAGSPPFKASEAPPLLAPPCHRQAKRRRAQKGDKAAVPKLVKQRGRTKAVEVVRR